MNWELNGLPLHPLIVHFVVVAFPGAALLLLLSAFWPAARRRLGIITPLLALASLIAVPLATSSGESLEEKVDGGALLETHTELGDTLLPWAIAVFVVAAALWAWQHYVLTPDAQRPTRRSGRPPGASSRSCCRIFVVVASVGAIVTTVRIGDSGAKAVWSDSSEG